MSSSSKMYVILSCVLSYSRCHHQAKCMSYCLASALTLDVIIKQNVCHIVFRPLLLYMLSSSKMYVILSCVLSYSRCHHQAKCMSYCLASSLTLDVIIKQNVCHIVLRPLLLYMLSSSKMYVILSFVLSYCICYHQAKCMSYCLASSLTLDVIIKQNVCHIVWRPLLLYMSSSSQMYVILSCVLSYSRCHHQAKCMSYCLASSLTVYVIIKQNVCHIVLRPLLL